MFVGTRPRTPQRPQRRFRGLVVSSSYGWSLGYWHWVSNQFFFLKNIYLYKSNFIRLWILQLITWYQTDKQTKSKIIYLLWTWHLHPPFEGAFSASPSRDFSLVPGPLWQHCCCLLTMWQDAIKKWPGATCKHTQEAKIIPGHRIEVISISYIYTYTHMFIL